MWSGGEYEKPIRLFLNRGNSGNGYSGMQQFIDVIATAKHLLSIKMLEIDMLKHLNI